MSPNRYRILNTWVNALTLEESVSEIEKIIARKVPTQHVVVNASKVNLIESDSELRRIVASCPLINADGASILWAARRLGVPVTERVTGIDLFERLVEVAAQKRYKIFLFGAKQHVVDRVKKHYESTYPDLEVVGSRNGYFTEDDELEIVSEMAASGADILFVAFSSPKKEYWINKYLNQLGIPFVMGVGGSFDVIAGEVNRAPMWMQNHGLEWFYRFAQEPVRLWKRYVVGNMQFVCLTYKYKYLRKEAR